MAQAELTLEVKEVLSILLYTLEGKDRFHVHRVEGGDMVDVTSQYEVLSVIVPSEDGKERRGFTVLKKESQ